MILKYVLCACLSVFSIQAASAVLDVAGGLVTRDTVSGLDWLDLTETNDLSYDFVSGQLDTGEQFAGWRYATNNEVVQLWANWGIDLSAGQPTQVDGFVDPAIATAVSFLGNIVHESSPDVFMDGTLGITIDQPNVGLHSWMGAYTGVNVSFYQPAEWKNFSDDVSAVHTGSYLVRDSAVPVPAAVWLFGSGLLGLIGVARRAA